MGDFWRNTKKKKTIKENIGDGGFGNVYKEMRKEENRICALKKVPIKNIESGISKNLSREMKCL